MDKHIVKLYNQALKDYDEAIQKLMKIEAYCKGCNLETDYTARLVLNVINNGGTL